MKQGLNIGAGPVHLNNDGMVIWENSDFAQTESAGSWKLEKLRDFTKKMDDIADNSIDFIMAWHIIEHVGLHEKDAIISEWFRVLKKGGVLFIACPDIVEIAKKIVSGVKPWDDPFIRAVNLYGPYNGFDGDYHKWGYDVTELARVLSSLGFAQVMSLDPTSLSSYIGQANAAKVGFADYNIQLQATK